jgi:prepilin-type N-terminal cleavage/methylation domain-containing protein
MARLHKISHRSDGFTIIELLISTLVFGVVLLIITTAILQITRVYYKGITEAKTQNVARNVVDSIGQNIQFNGGKITPTPASTTPGSSYAFCVGNQQYSYTLGYQLADNNPTVAQTYHALVVRNLPGCDNSSAAQDMRVADITGRELVGRDMRIAKLEVSSLSETLYKISVRIVFGDDDLLTNPNDANAKCIAQRAGTQFCASSELTTIVAKRIK